MSRVFRVVGVPSSAGAHGPGQEKAPAAFRRAGVIDRLVATGVNVIDGGDLPEVRFRPDPQHPTAQSLGAVLSVIGQVADVVQTIVEQGQIPLVIGGDCTITIGVLDAFLVSGIEPALLYMDGGMDLGTPATYAPGMFDSMGIAHIVDEPGSAPELARVGSRTPLLSGGMIVPYGFTPGEPIEVEQEILDRHAIQGFTAESVRGDASHTAEQAVLVLEQKAERFIVHFDVDVIDFVDFPISDVPHINKGIRLSDAFTALQVFVRSKRFGGLVITEFNPDHDDASGSLTGRFVKELAHVLAPARGRGSQD